MLCCVYISVYQIFSSFEGLGLVADIGRLLHLEAKKRWICKIYHSEMMQKIENILRYTLLVVAFLMPFVAYAQEDSVSYERVRTDHRVSVDFRVNKTVLDPNYRHNSTVISRVDSIFRALKEDTTITIEAVKFSGSASPEGNLQANKRLSRARMMEVEKFVRKHISFDDAIVVYDDRYVDWQQLIEFVEADTTLAMRDEVLRICNGTYPSVSIYGGLSMDGRIPELKKLDGGKVWRELLNRYFVKMRTGTVNLITYVDVPVIIERSEPVEEPVETPMEVVPESYSSSDSKGDKDAAGGDASLKRPLMGVRTNLLAYSTLIPNVGVEFSFADHWSAEITAMYSPYDLFRYNLKTRVLASKPEVRYWFGDVLREGHFVGLHVPLAGFNIQLEDSYRYQDPKRALWGVGINYGYAMLLGEEENWRLDFTIGLGYMDLRYNVYEGVRNGKFIRSEMKHYFGPTCLGINLSYLIDRKRGE